MNTVQHPTSDQVRQHKQEELKQRIDETRRELDHIQRQRSKSITLFTFALLVVGIVVAYLLDSTEAMYTLIVLLGAYASIEVLALITSSERSAD